MKGQRATSSPSTLGRASSDLESDGGTELPRSPGWEWHDRSDVDWTKAQEAVRPTSSFGPLFGVTKRDIQTATRRLSGTTPDRIVTFGRLKRAFDIIVSTIVLIVTAPVLIIATAAIKLESKGPVFYRSDRVGRFGEHFQMIRFRTMVYGADDKAYSLQSDFGLAADVLIETHRDPRITRMGRVLRRWSIDELPELFNVLHGEMSLVGPRPLLLEESERERYADSARHRLVWPPGVTGLWKICGIADLTFDQSVVLDLVYDATWSMWGDLVILAKTLRAVWHGTGA